MSNNKLAGALLLAISIAFVWGLIRLYDLRFVTGDIYPAYSSLRSDPLGSEAFYESVARLPGFSARRNFRDLDGVRDTNVTLLWLGEDPFSFALLTVEDLKEFEKVAARGVRLVFAMRPVKNRLSEKSMVVKDAAIEKRWGVAFHFVGQPATAMESIGDDTRKLPKQTALVMMAGGIPTPIVEKQFGSGSIVLAGNAYPFSNEALATERDTALLSRVIGPYHALIFDERHFGLSEQASIAMLAWKYRLMGLATGLLLLAALFIWRNSSPLLPARRRLRRQDVRLATERDSAAALHHLLRRNIAEDGLVPACVAEWEKSRYGGRTFSPEKLNIIRQLGAVTGKRPAAEVYRTVQSIISQRD